MIKGVNKQILEVTNTDSPYFEKIIFFVKPNSPTMDDKRLHAEAMKFSKTSQKPPRQKPTIRQIGMSVLYVAMGVGAGTALTYIMNSIL
ncbi:MAG: hypothetical protein ACI4IN_00355 [Eubacterium sp.]